MKIKLGKKRLFNLNFLWNVLEIRYIPAVLAENLVHNRF